MSAYSAEPNCEKDKAAPVLENKKIESFIEVSNKLPIQKFLSMKRDFESGTRPSLDLLKSNQDKMFKPIWKGVCVNAEDEVRNTEIRAKHFVDKYSGKTYDSAGVFPAYNENESEKEYFNRYRINTVPASLHAPTSVEKSVVIHSTGQQDIADMFNGKIHRFSSEIREVKNEKNQSVLLAKMNKEYKAVSDEETAKIAQEENAVAYCRFELQFLERITKQENTKGCFESYEKTRDRYAKGKKWSRIATAALVPYNFVVAGVALVANNVKKDNYASELSLMMQLFDEINNPQKETPVFNMLHEKIKEQNASYSKQKLMKLLKTANDSFYFCEPNIEEGWTFTLNDVASAVLDGSLTEDTFI